MDFREKVIIISKNIFKLQLWRERNQEFSEEDYNDRNTSISEVGINNLITNGWQNEIYHKCKRVS